MPRDDGHSPKHQTAVPAVGKFRDLGTPPTRLDDFADSIVVTTSPGVNRFRIDREIGQERIPFVTEGGLISEFTTEFFSLLGQRTDDTHGPLRSKRHPAIRALMLRAAQEGANAIVNVQLDYRGHTGERARYVLSGTMVVLVPM